MSDFTDLLDRRARQHRPADDDFTKVLDRADRRHRNRRITSGFVALAVAIAGSLGVYGMLTRGDAARTLGGVYQGIWPQTNLQEAEIAQARASNGDERFDDQVVAGNFLIRFANDGLGWVNTSISPVSAAQAAGRGPITATIRGCPFDETDQTTDVLFCPESAFRTAEVKIERLLEPGPRGLWMVTSATVDGAEPSVHPSTMPPLSSPGADDPGPEETTADAHPQIRDFVVAFMEARAADDSPEAREFLSDEAEAAFDAHRGGLQLYVYTTEGPEPIWDILSVTVRPDTDRWDVVVRITGEGGEFPESGTIHEHFVVGSPGDGAPLQILEAERNE